MTSMPTPPSCCQFGEGQQSYNNLLFGERQYIQVCPLRSNIQPHGSLIGIIHIHKFQAVLMQYKSWQKINAVSYEKPFCMAFG